MLVAVLLGLLTLPLAGGSLRVLADARVRALWAPPASLLVQALIATGALPMAAGRLLHLASYAIAALFVLANLDRRGIAVVAIGGAANALAIVANGGVMPARASAVARAGLLHDAERFHNSAVVEGARLSVLGDVFAVPASWPLANVFSIGDVILVLGGVLLAHELADAPWTRRRAGRAVPAPVA